ncbi:MAG: hypothetical protein CVV32_06680 [Methanomicrobiales archaeon HGW-Methanomicrobiales-3]|jgi:hypothetical protein|nr:MAG: hypothetical protein CVV32_06680 [Methanomicrobiales archaeon HGW-Methanomicrobiales-3]
MSTAGSPRPFHELVEIVDGILDTCEDKVPCIVKKLGELDPEVRSELFISDLLNAYQVFIYFFRTEPDILVQEQLELEPASSLRAGLMIDEVDLLEMFFVIRESKPLIIIHDGEKAVATFSGGSAYRDGREYLENPGYS